MYIYIDIYKYIYPLPFSWEKERKKIVKKTERRKNGMA